MSDPRLRIRCKCGQTIGCFRDPTRDDEYRCPECVMEERDAALDRLRRAREAWGRYKDAMCHEQDARAVCEGYVPDENADSKVLNDANRIVACVNALSGLAPSAVAGLIEAARNTCTWLNDWYLPSTCCGSGGMQHYKALLAALKAIGVKEPK